MYDMPPPPPYRRDPYSPDDFRKYHHHHHHHSHHQPHHEMSPPPKRMRPGGWDERDHHQDRGEHIERPPARPKGREREQEGFQPAMMTFKAFLATQDDTITDDEAMRKYGEYKMEFRRQQLNEFFVSHKENEWFRLVSSALRRSKFFVRLENNF